MDRWDNSTEKRGLQGKDHRSKCQKGQRMLWVALLHLLPDAWTVDHQRIKKLRHGQEVMDSSSFSNANATKNMKWGGLLFEVFCQVRLFVFGLLAKNYTKKTWHILEWFFSPSACPPNQGPSHSSIYKSASCFLRQMLQCFCVQSASRPPRPRPVTADGWRHRATFCRNFLSILGRWNYI